MVHYVSVSSFSCSLAHNFHELRLRNISILSVEKFRYGRDESFSEQRRLERSLNERTIGYESGVNPGRRMFVCF